MAQQTPAPRPPRKGSRAKLWLALHGWLALPVWAYLFFVCVTGSLATVSAELVWLIQPESRSTAPDGAPPALSPGALLARGMAAHPGGRAESISLPASGYLAPVLTLFDAGGRHHAFYLDRWDGHIQGEVDAFDLRYFLRALHGWLLTPFAHGYAWGWYAVSVLGVPMLGSLITGILVYKKFWRAYLQWPRLRRDKGARTFWGDLHRLAGLWTLPFVAIIAVTAIWFLILAILYDSGVNIRGQGMTELDPAQLPHAATRAELHMPDLDVMIANGLALDPGATFQSAWLPSDPYEPASLYMRDRIPLLWTAVSGNPYDGGVQLVGPSALNTASQLFRGLHTGDFLGLWLKLVYFVFGMMLSGLVLSGMMIWLRRTARSTVGVLRPERPAGAA